VLTQSPIWDRFQTFNAVSD